MLKGIRAQQYMVVGNHFSLIKVDKETNRTEINKLSQIAGFKRISPFSKLSYFLNFEIKYKKY